VRVRVAEQRVAQRGEYVDEPDAGLGPRVADGNPIVAEIDVAQYRAVASPMRRPAYTSVAMSGGRSGGSRLWPGVELRRVVDHRRDLLGPPNARICPSRVIVLLIDSARDVFAALKAREGSTFATVICGSRRR